MSVWRTIALKPGTQPFLTASSPCQDPELLRPSSLPPAHLTQRSYDCKASVPAPTYSSINQKPQLELGRSVPCRLPLSKHLLDASTSAAGGAPTKLPVEWLEQSPHCIYMSPAPSSVHAIRYPYHTDYCGGRYRSLRYYDVHTIHTSHSRPHHDNGIFTIGMTI